MRNELTVVAIRFNTGEDILAFLEGEIDGKLQLAYPHYVKFNPSSQQLMLLPFCSFSDEYLYTIPSSICLFVVTASNDVANRFIDALNQSITETIQTSLAEEEQLDKLESILLDTTYVSGNTTKH